MKFVQKKKKDLKELEKAELISYIEKLHKFLRKNAKKLHKYKDKMRELVKQAEKLTAKLKQQQDGALAEADKQKNSIGNRTSVDVDDDQNIKTTSNKEEDDDEVAATAAFDFVAEIRQVAEQAQNLNGFVYEPTSGLYYDQKTGYYYNAEYGLYYDGNTGCYYNYNQEKDSFEFHSQVPVQATKNAGNNCDQDDDDIEDMVEFDEWGGVITDKAKLQKIKDEKQKLKEEKDRYKANKKKTKPTNDEATTKQTTKHRHSHKHKAKKRKRHRVSASDSEPSDTDRATGYTKRSSPKRQSRKQQDRQQRDEIEDGELSSSSSSSSSSGGSRSRSRGRGSSTSGSDVDSDAEVPVFKAGGRFQDIAKKYPPSLRIIVQETNLEELKVGSLSLITFKGGTLGREGDHDVLIPDLNVSKCHLKFSYDTKHGVYKCIDLGSQNGTTLNGVRMSASKTESIAHDLVHGSIIQINQTKLLCHVHEGNSTCGFCEPGLLIESARETMATAATAPVMLTHKEQLKKLQKKYGLENEKFVDAGNKQNSGNYNDRAATRRTNVGSSTDKEKTQIASVDTEIPSENKGFKMLSKLGWSKGEALGKSTAGLLEPINVSGNTGTTGFGCEEHKTTVTLTPAEKKKIAAWKKVQERYQKSTDIFSVSDDSNQ